MSKVEASFERVSGGFAALLKMARPFTAIPMDARPFCVPERAPLFFAGVVGIAYSKFWFAMEFGFGLQHPVFNPVDTL